MDVACSATICRRCRRSARREGFARGTPSLKVHQWDQSLGSQWGWTVELPHDVQKVQKSLMQGAVI